MATFAEAPGAKEFEAQGVPADEAPQVALLAETLAEDFARYGDEALRDASTLLRFLRAREGKVGDAAAMWRDTHAWRRLHIPAALAEIGAFGDARAPLDAQRSDWTWAMFRDPTQCASARAALALKHGHAIRAPTLARDGSPVLVWRIGQLDLAGCARERLLDALCLRQVAHMEDGLQASRAISRAERRLVRCRVVVDLRDIRVLKTFAYVNSGLKPTMRIGKAYFPEVTASVTIVNAPFGFEGLWKVVSFFLNDRIRAKVCIVGSDYADALRDHAMIDDMATMPKSLGGAADDYGAPEPVAQHAGAAVDHDDPFVKVKPADDDEPPPK